jgi:predicted nucleic acid-binding protein
LSVLDAFAVIAYLREEPAAPEVQSLLGHEAALTAFGVGEVLDHLVRVIGASEEEAVLDLAQLGLLDGVDVSAGLGLAAGLLRARHYHHRRCAVSLADCVAAEVARARSDAVATADPALLDVCDAEGIKVIPLIGSGGARWSPAP